MLPFLVFSLIYSNECKWSILISEGFLKLSIMVLYVRSWSDTWTNLPSFSSELVWFSSTIKSKLWNLKSKLESIFYIVWFFLNDFTGCDHRLYILWREESLFLYQLVIILSFSMGILYWIFLSNMSCFT